MATRTLLSAIIGCLPIAGCASIQQGSTSQRPTSHDCNGSSNCFVDVSASGSPVIVDPEYVIVNNPRGQDIKITWRPAQGSNVIIEAVEFGDTQEQIHGCGQEGSSGQFRCFNHHTTSGVFKYTIKVR